MNISHHLYCKIFVEGPNSLEELILQTSNILDVEINGPSLKSKYEDIYADLNEDADMIKAFHGDFLFFPFFLDMEPLSENERTQYVSSVSNILLSFWNRGWQAVAACDFEDELPRHGGWNNGTLQK